MKPDDIELHLSKLAASIQNASQASQKLGLLAAQLGHYDAASQATLVGGAGTRATEDLACGRLLILLADVDGFAEAMGERFEPFRSAVAQNPLGSQIARFLQGLSGLDEGRLELFRAKLATLLQTLSTVNDRLESDRLPRVRLSGFDLAEDVLHQSGLDDRMVRIDLESIPRGAWTMVRDVLLDADFETVDENGYRTLLSEDAIKALGQVSGFGASLGASGAAKLSEAVAQRQALFIVKRLCLLVRSAMMYPPDHPGLPAAFEGLTSSIETAMGEDPNLTLTVVGGDVLLNDLKIRKEDRFKKTFCELFDDRNLTSVTFQHGFSLEELKTFVYCLTEAPRSLQERGGVRKILARKDAKRITVDQFRYGVVADDGSPAPVAGTFTDAGAGAAAGDVMLETLLHHEILAKVEKGGGIAKLTVEELGQFFREIFTDPDEEKRGALTRMLLAADPELLERGFLANPDVRRNLAWSAARKTLEFAFDELELAGHEDRETALETIGRIGELAVTRNKVTTLTAVTNRLFNHMIDGEDDADLIHRAGQALSDLAMTLVRRGRLDKARDVIVRIYNIASGRPERPLRIKVEQDIRFAAVEAIHRIGNAEDVVDVLVETVLDPEAPRAQLAMESLERLDTDLAVTKLFQVFLKADRHARARAYKTCKRFGKRALASIERELAERRERTYRGRDPSTGMFSGDADWYILRNCLDLLAEIAPERAIPAIVDASGDDDPRVRRESLLLLSKLHARQASEVMARALVDDRHEVREVAIHHLGVHQEAEAVDALIATFYRHPSDRKAVIDALERIASPPCIDFLLGALEAGQPGRADERPRSPFPADPDTVLQAIRALGDIGTKDVEKRLEEFLERWSNPARRILGKPVGGVLGFHELLEAAHSALGLAQRKNLDRLLQAAQTVTDRGSPS